MARRDRPDGDTDDWSARGRGGTRHDAPVIPSVGPRATSRPSRLLVACSFAVLVLAGCSNEARPTATPDARPMGPNPGPALSPPSATQWLDRVCTALQSAVRTDQPPAVVPTDPVGTRDRWAEYLERRAGALEQTVSGINAAGPAPVEGGQRVTESVVTLLGSRAEAARRGAGDLRAVPAVAEGTLLNTVEEVRSRFPLTGPATSLRDLALTPELTAQARSVESCRAVGSG